MLPKKKRDYTRLVLRRRDNNFGEIQEKNVQINPLPPVGSYVVILEKYRRCEDNYNRGDGVREYYVAASSYTDAYGRCLIYKVNSYSRGIDKPLDAGNMIELVHYYGGKENNGRFVSRLFARDVAIGCYRLDLVPDMEPSTFDISEIDFEDRVAWRGVGR